MITVWIKETLEALAKLSKDGVIWWPKNVIQARMPQKCKETFPDAR